MKIINYITGFLIIIFIQYICTKVLNFMHINIPSSILGIIVLALLLEFKIIKKEIMKDICELLMSNMPLLFIPLFVGIITYFGLIKENFIPIVVNVILTSVITLIVSAIFTENIIKFIRLKKIKGNKNA